MNKLPTKLLAVAMLIATTASSVAVETKASALTLTAPTVLTRKAALNPTDIVKYRQLADQSQSLITTQAAGASATTKTVLIVAGVIVLVVGVVFISGLVSGMAGEASIPLPAH